MGEFDAIRPYDDAEVPAVLARLLSDPAFLDILGFSCLAMALLLSWFSTWV